MALRGLINFHYFSGLICSTTGGLESRMYIMVPIGYRLNPVLTNISTSRDSQSRLRTYLSISLSAFRAGYRVPRAENGVCITSHLLKDGIPIPAFPDISSSLKYLHPHPVHPYPWQKLNSQFKESPFPKDSIFFSSHNSDPT